MKRFPGLVNAKSEVETIFGVPPTRGIVNGKFLSNHEFTNDSLRERLRQHLPLVHIASHFRLVPGDATSSFLLLGDGNKLTLADLNDEPDDLFQGVELLTLSACETGVQKERESDGREIDSLAELAQHKQAQAIIASLWNVDDLSTSRLMLEFYQKRQQKNLTKAEALQEAQLSLLKSTRYSHPFYWSPFILVGNWR
jgi:CHAT domain-containing protein